MIRILAVDDEPLMLEYLERFLTNLFGDGVRVTLAQNGKDALELLEAVPVELVITDIRMPVMDGLELARQISERKLQAKVIILSGYEDFSYAHQALKYSVSDYLLKPVSKEELALAVQKQISQIKLLKRRRQDYLQVVSNSNAYRTLVGQNLISAVTHRENLRLQQYYKLACQLGIEEIQTDGAILLLEVDRWKGACTGLPPREQGVFAMILAQQVSELLGKKQLPGFSVPEPDGKTLVYLAGEDHLQVQKQARDIYRQTADYLRVETNTFVSGALGRVYPDVLQMDASYRQAENLLAQRIVTGKSSLQLAAKGSSSNFCGEMRALVSDLYSCAARGREVGCHLQLTSFAAAMPDFECETVYRFGLFLAERLFAAMPQPEPVRLDAAVQQLNARLKTEGKPFDAAETGELMGALVQCFCAQGEQGVNCSQLIAASKRYIYQHYSEPISLALLAEELGVSESYLSSLFHKETGESYIKLLTRVRMEKAAELLRANRNIKMYEVAHQVGYFNAKHFNHVFKQWQGVPPNEYQLRFFGEL